MLRIVPIKELVDFTEEVCKRSPQAIPITPLRALSQANNPMADPDDPALVVAYNDANELMAYYGCLPDKLAAAPNEKICWNSCWWGHPELGKSATMQVFYQGLKLWNGKVLFDALPPQSEKILRHMGYVSFRKIEGLHGLLRFKWQKILTRRFPTLQTLGFLLGFVDSLLNGLYGLRFLGKHGLAKGLVVEQLAKPDAAAAAFIEKHNQKELVGRSPASISWILEYPWLEQTRDGKGPFSQSYYFSAYAKVFTSRLLKVLKEGEIVAVILLTFRDGELKVPYVYYEKEQEVTVLNVLINNMLSLKAETFVCFQPQLVASLKKRAHPFYYTRSVEKVFGYSKTLEHLLSPEKTIQDGDGDVVFT